MPHHGIAKAGLPGPPEDVLSWHCRRWPEDGHRSKISTKRGMQLVIPTWHCRGNLGGSSRGRPKKPLKRGPTMALKKRPRGGGRENSEGDAWSWQGSQAFFYLPWRLSLHTITITWITARRTDYGPLNATLKSLGTLKNKPLLSRNGCESSLHRPKFSYGTRPVLAEDMYKCSYKISCAQKHNPQLL